MIFEKQSTETFYTHTHIHIQKTTFPFSSSLEEREAKKSMLRLDRRRIPIEQKSKVSKEPMAGEVRDGGRRKSSRCYIRFFRWKVQNRIRVTSVCRGPGGKPTQARRRDRVKILSYFRMTGLGLVSEACFPIFDPTTACLGNVLFDIARCLIEINRVTIYRKVINLVRVFFRHRRNTHR